MKQIAYKFNERNLTPSKLNKQNETELRKEYTRLRAIANKRIKRLGESEFKDLEIAQKYSKFPTLKELDKEGDKAKRALSYELMDVMHFLDMKTGSVSGLKEMRTNVLKSLHKRGEAMEITEKNFVPFLNFMEETRATLGSKFYDSYAARDYFLEKYDAGELTAIGYGIAKRTHGLLQLSVEYVKSLTV